MNAEFSLFVEITNAKALVAAARVQARKEGHSAKDASEVYTVKNLDQCLRMLLDPGHLPGCKILDSTAEVET